MKEIFLDKEGVPFVLVSPGRRLFRIDGSGKRVEIEDRSMVSFIDSNSVEISEEEAIRLASDSHKLQKDHSERIHFRH